MIFVSACLVGCKCRYDGNDALVQQIKDMFEQGFLFPICPEVIAGLPIPRTPMMINGCSGDDVLEGKASVIDINGADLTPAFIKSAQKCVETAQMFDIKKAVLKSKSPSCGVFITSTSDGKKNARGVAAAALHKAGITLYDENCDINKVIL